jgi:Trypsin-like peptidase domain
VLVQEAIAEVLEVQPNGQRLSAGTAFAISREFALTAFHVIGKRETGVVWTNAIVLRFRRRHENDWTEAYECGVSYRDGDHRLDAAVLQLEKPLPDDLHPIALTDEFDEHEPFVSAGHPRLEGPMSVTFMGQLSRPKLRFLAAFRPSSFIAPKRAIRCP